MRHLLVAGVLSELMGITLAGCASAPVRDVPTISYDGYFGGPVVADYQYVPISTRYQNLCEGRAERWRYGWYRPYGPCDVVPVTAVRAKY